MIPQTFDEWKNCIVNDCKINLNKEFADQRLKIYTNNNHSETQKFNALYGEQHLKNIIHWFEQISKL